MTLRGPRSFVAALGLVSAATLAFSTVARADEPVSTVFVHIASPRPVRLERRTSSHDVWGPACESPCDRELPAEDEYRVVYGESLDPGDAFRLRAKAGGEVSLNVDPTSSTAGNAVGTGMMVAGGGLAAVSLVGVISGLALAAPAGCDQPGSNDWCGLGQALGAGIALVAAAGLLVGVGVLAGGAVVRASSGPTTKQEPSSSASVREPMWAAPRVASSGKPPIFVPLSFSF